MISSTNGGTVFAYTNAVRLVKAGTPVGNTKGPGSDYTAASFHDETWGSGSDLWGTTWTSSDINNANFGVELQSFLDAIQCNPCGPDYYARINNFRLTVTYTAALRGVNYFYIADSDQDRCWSLSDKRLLFAGAEASHNSSPGDWPTTRPLS